MKLLKNTLFLFLSALAGFTTTNKVLADVNLRVKQTAEVIYNDLKFDTPVTDHWNFTEVIDGDTVVVSRTGQLNVEVDLCGIYSPNSNQSFINTSRAYLFKLLSSADSRPIIKNLKRNNYGRFVAEIFINTNGRKLLINEQQVKGGSAYSHASNKCENRDAIEQAQEYARENKLGVWHRQYLEKYPRP